MKKIIVLNFETGEVIIDTIETANEVFVEKFFEDNNLSQNNCQWMIVDELNIQMSNL